MQLPPTRAWMGPSLMTSSSVLLRWRCSCPAAQGNLFHLLSSLPHCWWDDFLAPVPGVAADMPAILDSGGNAAGCGPWVRQEAEQGSQA